MIRARKNRDDPFIAVERQMKMRCSQLVTFVTETESIVAPRSRRHVSKADHRCARRAQTLYRAGGQ
jgi:hypothetical protein